MTDPRSPHPFRRFADLLGLLAHGAALLWIPLLLWNFDQSQQADLPQPSSGSPEQWSRISPPNAGEPAVRTAATFEGSGLEVGATPPATSTVRGEAPAGLLAIASSPESITSSAEGDDPLAPLMTPLQGAEALGGELSLEDLEAKPVPVAALAERRQWKRSGDPLAPLPRHWREEMRGALPAEATQVEAEVVRLPAPHLVQPEEVPLAIHDNGDAWSLAEPRSAPSREIVEQWATRQQAPSQGSARAVVVTLEPIEAAPPPVEQSVPGPPDVSAPPEPEGLPGRL